MGPATGERNATCYFCGKPERRSRLPLRDRQIVLTSATLGAHICSVCVGIALRYFEHRRKPLFSNR